MTDVYIEEYRNIMNDADGLAVQAVGQHTAKQKIASSGTSAASAAFNAKTTYIVVTADGAVHFNLGGGAATAATTDPYIPANTPRAFAICDHTKLAVIDKA